MRKQTSEFFTDQNSKAAESFISCRFDDSIGAKFFASCGNMIHTASNRSGCSLTEATNRAPAEGILGKSLKVNTIRLVCSRTKFRLASLQVALQAGPQRDYTTYRIQKVDYST